ncbi:hypothetical protein ACJ3XI_02630 [Litorimonas sp. RW-G-Af-16]|uniref:hypothetical protein n=1 Tax=Litorimonas sp. RW-G-Af-16 TaxID=3241168 RepID=UPI00390CBE9E
MIRGLILMGLGLTLLGACARAGYGQGGGYYPEYQPRPGQGQYIRPDWLAPSPTPMIPAIDACRSQLYAGLVGQHEGAIYIAGLPGRKRVLKPAFLEDFETEQVAGIDPDPPLLEVRDYLPQQVLYAPSIRTVTDRIQLGPEDGNRLTLELDVDGYLQEIRCG